MVLFRTKLDEQLFLMEINEDRNKTISKRDHDVFIRKRERVVPLLKEFQHHKVGGNVIGHMRSVFKMKRWHHSPEGRTFHRKLGRFLSTRDTERTKIFLGEKYELLEFKRFLEHELTYYSSLVDYVKMSTFLDAINSQL